MIRASFLASLALLTVAVAGCAQQAQPTAAVRSPQDAASLTACRERVDGVLAQRDRALLYTDDANAQRNMNGRGDPTVDINRLARRYERDRQVDDCMRSPQSVDPQPANEPAPVIIRR